jgi:diguanylate cyclase (GGDEF)-like protein
MSTRISFFKQYQYLLAVILIPMIFVGFYSYKKEREKVIDAAVAHIRYNIDAKEELLERLFLQHKINIENIGRIVKILRNQKRVYIENIQYTKVEQLNSYINSVYKNLHLLVEKNEILTLISRLKSSKNVARFASQYLPFVRDDMQLDEIYLVDSKGFVMSCSDSDIPAGYDMKELTSTFKKAFEKSKLPENRDKIIFADFSKKSTDGSYMAFAMLNVSGGERIVISLSKDIINHIMQFRTDNRSSLESYLIGYDDNRSYLVNDRVVKKGQKIGDFKTSKQIIKAYNGQSGIDTKIGSTGHYEIEAYMPISYRGLIWSIHTTISYEELLTSSIDNNRVMYDFTKNYGYYDLFFIDKYGNVFYTIEHESDYQSNIYTGTIKDTHFAETIRKTVSDKKMQISGFESYAPSNGEKAGFISQPILDENNNVELVMALQIPFESMQKIMMIGSLHTFHTHSFIIDKDYKVLVDSDHDTLRHNSDAHFLSSIKKIIDTKSNNKVVEIKDDRLRSLSINRPILRDIFQWNLLVQIPYDQIQDRLFWVQIRLLASLFSIVLIALFFLWRFAKNNKQHAQELEKMAYNDILTGLANRSFFLEHLEHTLEYAKRKNSKLAILFIDLDHFKYINDSYGHASGDNVLIQAANRLKKCVRKEDFVARIGGDEFIILLRDIENIVDIEIISQKINNSLSQPIKDDENHVYHIGCSIGISLYPYDTQDAELLITYADTAMYKAKERGRNQHSFYKPEITDSAKNKVTLLNDLSQAIVKDEFIVYYQPQINPISGELVSAEALVRWQHPTKGLLFPDSFIDMAEESRKIIPLGNIVLRKACNDFLLLRDRGIKLDHIAVNISAKQLFAKDFTKDVVAILQELNFNPRYLELEITETSMVENIDKAVGIMRELSTFGVRFSIDDFGTGFSSLEYLKKLPVSTLKIDRTFVIELPDVAEDIAIINAVMYMAKEFGFEIVVEGVETIKQIKFLINSKKDILIQGYYYSKPVDLDTFISTYS